MSLINEALKRARVEAARREAAAKGVPPSALPVYVPRRRRLWLAPVMGFGVGLAVVAVAAGGYWLARSPRPEAPPAARLSSPPVEAASAPPAAVVPQTASPAGVPPSEEPAPRSEPGTRAPEPPPPSPTPLPASPLTTSSSAPPAGPPSVTTPAPRREPSRPAPEAAASLTRVRGLESGRTYRIRVEPLGLAPVKLDFIVWSATSPFAQINGSQVSPGQSVDGYQLLAIERERVQLEGGGVRFWLRAR